MPSSATTGRLALNKSVAHQIEIGDPIDFIVIRNAAVAIAEADLRPHIQLDLLAARRHVAMKARPAGHPSRGNGQAISRQRAAIPDLHVLVAATPDNVAITAAAATSPLRMPLLRPHGSPAIARAGPVSSRMCRPVLARSTM